MGKDRGGGKSPRGDKTNLWQHQQPQHGTDGPAPLQILHHGRGQLQRALGRSLEGVVQHVHDDGLQVRALGAQQRAQHTDEAVLHERAHRQCAAGAANHEAEDVAEVRLHGLGRAHEQV